MNSAIASLILAIAANVGVPPYLALSVALEENQALNPLAVHVNRNGTEDRGVMQLNSSWFTGDWRDPETNIRAGCLHLKWLMRQPGITTWWDAVVAYNCGYSRFIAGPPAASMEYACRVFDRWNKYRGYEF
jgi:soluble lytic murein transglycosylase-like protein